ncbi:NAD(P)H-hydrate dehydratase [bacterium]|nr:NAD(P)H-hydrate dehydratase [bacterium]
MVEYIDNKFIHGMLPRRTEDSNKSTFGRILNIAGSKNYIGAAYLSTMAALKVGAGLVTLACPDYIVPIIAAKAPEPTYIYLKTNSEGAISADNNIKELQNYNVISIGCGISTHDDTKHFMFGLLNKLSIAQKVVIDADGINILANHKGEVSLKNTIITPHPMELSRLLNVSVDEIINNREKYARITSQTYECITVLKGHKTLVTDGQKIYINKSGSSALAKAGTGDVLTGIIAGLLAQRANTLEAAIMGTYLHGLSGDIAANDLTKYAVMASDIITYLPFAISEVMSEA